MKDWIWKRQFCGYKLSTDKENFLACRLCYADSFGDSGGR